jgi:hypothetical protein
LLNGAESRARLSDGGIPMRQRLRCVPHPAPRTGHGLSEQSDEFRTLR